MAPTIGTRRRQVEMVVERGDGPCLVLIPGIQGPWEYARPAVEALAKYFRVVTFPLGMGCGPAGIDGEVERVEIMLDERRIVRAIVCGISYGGVVATRFAATRGARASALIVASAPGAGWHLKRRHEIYARWPSLCGPCFLVESPFRLTPELAAAFPERRARWRFARWQLQTMLAAPFSFSQMAERAMLIGRHDIAADCERVSAPTLVVTGEAELDMVVPVESTATYAALIRGARTIVLERTGHLGTITRPSLFADTVNDFVQPFVTRPSPNRGGAGRPAPHTEVA